MTRDEAWIAAAKICQDVAELPDRDSCEHMTPDDMLVTGDELQPMIAAAILAAVAAERERIGADRAVVAVAARQPREITDSYHAAGGPPHREEVMSDRPCDRQADTCASASADKSAAPPAGADPPWLDEFAAEYRRSYGSQYVIHVSWEELSERERDYFRALARPLAAFAVRQPREITDAMVQAAVEAFLDSWYGSRAWDKHYPPDHSAHAFTEETVLDRRRGCRAALEAAERARTEK